MITNVDSSLRRSYLETSTLLPLALLICLLPILAMLSACSEQTEAEKAAEATRAKNTAWIKAQLPGVTRGDLIAIGDIYDDVDSYVYARVLNRTGDGTRVRYLETGEVNVLNDDLSAASIARIISAEDPAWCGIITRLYTE